MKIVIGGYYGYKSLGDEAVLSVLTSSLKTRYPNCRITVLSASPKKTAALYGCNSIHRYHISSIVRCLSEAQLYISGGGSLMQDSTSARSLNYYCALIHLAKSLGTKVYAYANGIGPLKNPQKAISAISKCDHISVRDEDSLRFLQDNNIEATLSADPFVLCEAAEGHAVRRYLYDRGVRSENYFTVSLRRCSGRRQINEDALLHVLLPYIIKGYTPVFVSMQDRCDLAICAAMADMTGGHVITPTEPSMLLGIQRDAQFAIGMRLHFLLAAACTHTPLLALSYDPKVASVLKYVANVDVCDAFDFDSCLLADGVPPKRQEKIDICSLRALATSDFDAVSALIQAESDLVEA